MTVADLIARLKTMPPEMLVAYKCIHDHSLMHADDLEIKELCQSTASGWVCNAVQDDSLNAKYLVFPGGL